MKKKVFEEVKKLIENQKLDIDLKQNEDCIVKEFQDKVSWYWISARRQLSESFIREFHDEVDWNAISYKQILSESFIKEFKDKIDWHWINENKKIIKTEKLQEEINRELLIRELHR